MTFASALRQAVVDAGLVSGRLWRDRAPERPTTPYITYVPETSSTPALKGDARVVATERLAQVSLWQSIKDEDDSLRHDVNALLDGLVLYDVAPWSLCTVRVDSVQRLAEVDVGLVQHVFLLNVRHDSY